MIISSNDLLKNIKSSILEVPSFKTFKWINKERLLLEPTSFGFYAVELVCIKGYDLDNDCLSFELSPIYSVRFDELHAWFEPYSFKKKADLKYLTSSWLRADDFGLTRKFFFHSSGQNYNDELNKLQFTLQEAITKLKMNIVSLQDVYLKETVPMLDNNFEFPNRGVEWIFESLYLVHKYNPNGYLEFKDRIEKHFWKMEERGEPNVLMYASQFKTIVSQIS